MLALKDSTCFAREQINSYVFFPYYIWIFFEKASHSRCHVELCVASSLVVAMATELTIPDLERVIHGHVTRHMTR